MYKGEAPGGEAVAVKVMALSSETAEEVRKGSRTPKRKEIVTPNP